MTLGLVLGPAASRPAGAAEDDPSTTTTTTRPDKSDKSDTPTTPKQPTSVTSTIQAVSGVRTGSTTLIGGGVVNGTDAAADVTIVVSDLPSGVSVADARPSVAAPIDGLGWSCAGNTCRLVNATGEPQRLAAGSGVQALLALQGGELPASGGHVTVEVGDTKPSKVNLDRTDGQPPLPDQAIGMNASGPSTIAPGASGATTVVVNNLGTQPVDAGSTVITSALPAIPGLVITGTGPGWTCGPIPITCTYAPAVEPLGSTPPLVFQMQAPAAEPTPASSNGTIDGAATIAGAPVAAPQHPTSLTIRPEQSHDVSVGVTVQRPAVQPPDTQEVSMRVTPLGGRTVRRDGHRVARAAEGPERRLGDRHRRRPVDLHRHGPVVHLDRAAAGRRGQHHHAAGHGGNGHERRGQGPGGHGPGTLTTA